MGEKLERVFRTRKLTPEEVARDEEVRRRVQEEYPPAKASFTSGPLSESLRHAIRASGRSVAQIADDSGVAPIVVSRFLSGEGDIHMATADKLAEALGLKVAALR
jgi:hypothetical protein